VHYLLILLPGDLVKRMNRREKVSACCSSNLYLLVDMDSVERRGSVIGVIYLLTGKLVDNISIPTKSFSLVRQAGP
jgi:hypothetical protein